MCNLSGLIEEKGIKQGEEQGRHFERIAMIQKMLRKGYSKKSSWVLIILLKNIPKLKLNSVR